MSGIQDESFFDGLDELGNLSDPGPALSPEKKSGRGDCSRCRWPSLYEVSALLNCRGNTLDAVLTAILDTTIEISSADRGFLVLLDENDRTSWHVKLARKKNRVSLSPDQFTLSRTVVQEVVGTGTSLYLPDVTASEKFSHISSVINLELLSAMCAPLLMDLKRGFLPAKERRQAQPLPGKRVLGVLYVDTTSLSAPFSEEGLTLFEALANHAATAIINATLYHQATTDPLTGLLFRRSFEQTLGEELVLASATERPLSFLMIDLDHFKVVNDYHGHPAGDEVLKEFGRLLQHNTRDDDFCCRYGGEEFALLLPNTDLSGAKAIAEKLKKGVADHAFPCDIRLTISLGIAVYPYQAKGPEELITHADQALYQAKNEGRNRWVVWEEALGGTARMDKLAGILTGDPVRDYTNVSFLLDTLLAINSTKSLEEVLALTLDRMIAITRAERGILFLLLQDGKLHPRLGREKGGKPLVEISAYSRSFPEAVLRSGRPDCFIEGEEGRELLEKGSSVENLKLRTMVGVPLRAKGRILGVIYTDSHLANKEFAESHLTFFEAVASQLALAVEHTRLLAEARKGGA